MEHKDKIALKEEVPVAWWLYPFIIYNIPFMIALGLLAVGGINLLNDEEKITNEKRLTLNLFGLIFSTGFYFIAYFLFGRSEPNY